LIVLAISLGVFTRGADGVDAVGPAPAPTTATTSSPTNTVDNDALLRSVLVLQEQLRTTQREVQKAREEAEAASRHTAELLTERLNFIETKQIDTIQSANQLMLKVVAIVSALACIAVALSGWAQMRAVSKLAAISHQLEMLPSLAAPTNPRQLTNGEAVQPTPTVQTSTDNLSDNVARLQRRLDELEHTANGTSSHTTKELSVGSSRATATIAKGQGFLNVNKPDEALACFEEATEIDPRNIEGWLKKGSALERLQRIDEAIAAYDKAIEIDQSTATAYLFKAGVFNRQKRYAEALQCYEKALNVQKSRSAGTA
jgi:tetratricopeptide (TPR) repeat protein